MEEEEKTRVKKENECKEIFWEWMRITKDMTYLLFDLSCPTS